MLLNPNTFAIACNLGLPVVEVEAWLEVTGYSPEEVLKSLGRLDANSLRVEILGIRRRRPTEYDSTRKG